MQHGLRTLAFCKTRKLCELVTAYTRETLRSTAPHLAQVPDFEIKHCLAPRQRVTCLHPAELEFGLVLVILQQSLLNRGDVHWDGVCSRYPCTGRGTAPRSDVR